MREDGNRRAADEEEDESVGNGLNVIRTLERVRKGICEGGEAKRLRKKKDRGDECKTK